MNIFNVKKTAKAIKNEEISEPIKFFYFFIFSISTMSSTFIKPNNTTDIVYEIAYYSIALIGLIFCFFSNKNNDNQSFIERFVILSIPAVFSSLLYFAFVVGLILSTFFLFGIKIQNIEAILPYLNTLPHAVCIIIYIRIYLALKKI